MAEVALATALVAAAGLLWRSFDHLQDTYLGLGPQVLSFRISLPANAYPERADRADFLRRALDALAAVPGVDGAAAINSLPLTLVNTATALEIQGLPTADGGRRSAAYRQVLSGPAMDGDDGGYFATVGIPLRHGRLLASSDEPADAERPGVAVVNETFARQVSELASAADLVGRRLDLLGLDLEGVEIVGVVADVRQAGPMREARPTVYLPGLATASVGFVVASARDPSSLAGDVRAAVAALDPAQPVHAVATLGELAEPWIGAPRFHASLMALFAGLSLALAALGVYGVLAHSVARRRRDLGVRMALGAAPRSLFVHVVAEGLRPVVLGLLIGATGSLFVGRFLEGMLFGLDARDPATLAATCGVLLTVAVLAAVWPARRALSVDPVRALRQE